MTQRSDTKKNSTTPLSQVESIDGDSVLIEETCTKKIRKMLNLSVNSLTYFLVSRSPPN